MKLQNESIDIAMEKLCFCNAISMLLGANIYAFSQKGLFYRFMIFSISKNGKKVTICYFFPFRHMARNSVQTKVWQSKTSMEKHKIKIR